MGRGQELLDAARKGEKRIVEKLTKRSGPFTSLRRGAGVNVQDDNGYTPLHHACLRGHQEIVRLLLSVDASPCIVDKKGATPLHLAAWKGDSEIVAMLLAHDNPPVNIDQQTSDHETALLMAAQFGYVDVVTQLMARGADVTIRNIKEESALDLAALYGRLETVQHLLRARPQLVDPYKYPICRGRLFNSTPLHRASKNGHEEVVSTLIAAGIDPNIRTYNGTPLHEAANFGKAAVVRILLSKGADLKATDRRGKTVHDLLADYSEAPEPTRNVKQAIREYESLSRNAYESEEDLPRFPVQDYSPTYPNSACLKVPDAQKNNNKSDSLLSPSSSSLTKNHPQSFVKKLASKCLGLKAKFNSAPNIFNSSGLESDDATKSKKVDHKSNTSTLLIGNSKFFKLLAKKEDTGEIVCTDEFDTISLDRLGTLNRDSAVNRSNRSCPGFKTSLPNISENTELSDHESIPESVVITEINELCDSEPELAEAVNYNTNLIFEPRHVSNLGSHRPCVNEDAKSIINKCYEPYEFSDVIQNKSLNATTSTPKPIPRSTAAANATIKDETIYENVVTNARPTPAARIHILPKAALDESKTGVYENVVTEKEKVKPEPPKRTALPVQMSIKSESESSPSVSRSSTLSTDSMIDESNLEDILLSEKSKSFTRAKNLTIYPGGNKTAISRTQSNASSFSHVTDSSAIENVDCSEDVDEKPMYLSMTGTLPNKKSERPKKKVLFRHKTFTNIEVDRNSTHVRDLPKWDNEFLKETLAHYHIRGTGHCIYKGPTVQEFIYIFNKETLYKDVEPFTKVANNKRDSYYETAICFCRPRPPKHHNSTGDLLEITPQNKEEKVSIDLDALIARNDIVLSSFRCFCDSETCALHHQKRESLKDFVVKFSAIKKSISTPDITLHYSPESTAQSSGLPKIKSVPSKLEEPYAVVNITDIVSGNKASNNDQVTPSSAIYTLMSQHSTLSSSASVRPYSIKDIAEVISLSDHSTLTDTSLTFASSPHISLRKSSSSEHSDHWSLQSCNSNVTIKSDLSFKTCIEESSEEDSDASPNSDDGELSDAETIKSDISITKRPWVHSNSFRFGSKDFNHETDDIIEETNTLKHSSSKDELSSKFESGISVDGSDSSLSGCEDVPRVDDVSLGVASLERVPGVVGGVRSGSGRRRWDEAEGTSEGDALSLSSAASSCAPHHLAHHLDYSKVSPTPPKKPPRRNLSVSPTHANSPSSGYSYELRTHARSQDDLDDIPSSKHYLKHGRSVDQYVDGKLSYSEYEENHNSPRVAPIPNPRPSLKNRTQPVAITAMYENVVIKEQNPRRKLRRNPFSPNESVRFRKNSNQERSSLESLLDDQSMNSPSDCERYYDGQGVEIPLSPSHYDQPPTPDHPPPSARQAENSIHERIRPLSQLIMEVVEEIRIRKKSQSDISEKS